MGDNSLDDFNDVLGSGTPSEIQGVGQGRRPCNGMFENPFYSEYTLSRIARSRQNHLQIENSWTTGTPSCERTSPSTNLAVKDHGHSCKLLATHLVGEMAFAVASTLGFIALTDRQDVPMWLTGSIFAISSVVLTAYVTMGRKTYPANVFAFCFFLCATMVVVIHANLSGFLEFHIYNLELATLCCFAGSLAFLVLSYLPLFRIRRMQLLYSVPPIILSLVFASMVSLQLYEQTPWSSFGIVSIAAAIIVPASFISTIMIKHYILCVP